MAVRTPAVPPTSWPHSFFDTGKVAPSPHISRSAPSSSPSLATFPRLWPVAGALHSPGGRTVQLGALPRRRFCLRRRPRPPPVNANLVWPCAGGPPSLDGRGAFSGTALRRAAVRAPDPSPVLRQHLGGRRYSAPADALNLSRWGGGAPPGAGARRQPRPPTGIHRRCSWDWPVSYRLVFSTLTQRQNTSLPSHISMSSIRKINHRGVSYLTYNFWSQRGLAGECTAGPQRVLRCGYFFLGSPYISAATPPRTPVPGGGVRCQDRRRRFLAIAH